MSLESFIHAMPKVELHVHFAGTVRPKTLVALSRKHGRPLPEPALEETGAWPPFHDFTHFITAYTQVSGMIRSVVDIELVAREFLEDQAAQNIVYTEITFTAYGNHFIRGIPFPEQLAALNRARVWAESNLGVTYRIILDIPRERSAEETLVMADWAIEGMEQGVVGIGLAGDELRGPAAHFVEAFQKAKDAGLARIPHAGETSGPDSVRTAIRDLDATRIAHGVRCVEDPQLVSEIKDREIALDVCPGSNVCTGVCTDLESHPIRQLFEAGVNITIGSDDPPMFNTTLTQEYISICDAYGWGASEVGQLLMNGVRAALLPDQERAAVEAGFGAELWELRASHGL